jgi:hypothetical protein
VTDLFSTLSPEGYSILLATYPNERRKGMIYHEYVRNEKELQRFIRNYDKPGRAVYFTVAKLKDGATRAKENVEQVSWIWAEVDFKDHPDLTADEIQRRIEASPFPPTIIVASGHGLHCYWQLNEATDAKPGKAQQDVEDALKLACAYIGGDTNAAEAARVLRLPGSHNTKFDDNIPVTILVANGHRYEMSDLVEFWQTAQPLLPLPAKPKGNGRQGADTAAFDNDGPVDVEARLRDMRYKASGENSIHRTQLQVTGALLRQGVPLNDITAQVLEATRRAVVNDPRCSNWDWDQEECDIALMATDLICKDPTLAPCLPDELWEKFQDVLRSGGKPKISYGATGLYVRGTISDDEPTSNDKPASNNGTASSTGTDFHASAAQAASNDWPTPYSGRAPAQIPLRQFLLGKHYSIGACSITAAAGGIGKSTLSLLDAVSFRVGRDLLTGEFLDGTRRVWVWNAEDDVDEMERRIIGICAHYSIDRTEIRDGLYLDSGYELPLDLARSTVRGAWIDEPLIDRIAARVKERNISVISLDPLIALHTMPEGDNPGHAKLIRTLNTRLAKPAECCVDIDHHTRKLSVGQLGPTVDDIRGAGSIIYAARSSRILNPMTLAEAEKYSIEAEERFSYYRLERVKANMAKRGTICWVRMIEVPIANRPDGSYGDTIAVPVLWAPPNSMEGVTDTVAAAIAGEIAKGEYRRDGRAASWAGKLIGIRCGIDVGTESGKRRAKDILEELIKKGWLGIDIRTDKNRHTREFVVPGPKVRS